MHLLCLAETHAEHAGLNGVPVISSWRTNGNSRWGRNT